MPQKPWTRMTADEKGDHLNQILSEFIGHQNGANARFSSRLKALEEWKEQTDKAALTKK